MKIGDLEIRRLDTYIQDTFSEAGQDTDRPLRKVAVAAIVKNSFAGKPFEPDLVAHIDASLELGTRIAEMAKTAMAPYGVESFGKAAIAGTNGEQEHGIAFLTSVYGNALRDVLGEGKAWISSMTKRAPPGSTIDIPMNHINALYVRSHYDGMTLTLHDAPLSDEIVIICCFANRGRLNHRVGGPEANNIIGEDGLR